MKTHGLAPRNAPKHDLYKVWCEMRQRCVNPKKGNFKYYGGRGIRVCERWLSFVNFVDDMGPRQPGQTLDRINRDGDYEPSNCRWADKITQANNTSFNRHVVVHGEKLTLSEAGRKYGLRMATIWNRLEKGWPDEDAVLRPLYGRSKYQAQSGSI